MKNLYVYLAFLFLIGASACKDKVKAPKTGPDVSDAALEVYHRYANDTNLTVAYLGDFCINGKPIDAVMLQAKNDDDWDQLLQNFEISNGKHPESNLSVCPDDEKIISVGVGIETDFLEVLGLDKQTTRDQITEEHIRKYSENVALQIRDILSSLGNPDSLMPGAAVMVGEGPIEVDNGNTSSDTYVNAIAEAIAYNIIDEYFTVMESGQADSVITSVPASMTDDEIMTSAKIHGHSGYVTASDYNHRTLWLFFYDNQEDCYNILAHIKKDIVITE